MLTRGQPRPHVLLPFTGCEHTWPGPSPGGEAARSAASLPVPMLPRSRSPFQAAELLKREPWLLFSMKIVSCLPHPVRHQISCNKTISHTYLDGSSCIHFPRLVFKRMGALPKAP